MAYDLEVKVHRDWEEKYNKLAEEIGVMYDQKIDLEEEIKQLRASGNKPTVEIAVLKVKEIDNNLAAPQAMLVGIHTIVKLGLHKVVLADD
jgi:hypothetical protein